MINSNNPLAIKSQLGIKKAMIVLMRKYLYNEITVKQIILEAGISRKTFYRNYSSKDDVLISLIKEPLDDYFNIVNNNKVDLLTTIFSFVEKNKELLFLLDKNDMLYSALQYISCYDYELKRSNESLFNPFIRLFDGLDSDYLFAFNCGAIWNVIVLWVHRGMKDSPESVKAMISNYLLRLKWCDMV